MKFDLLTLSHLFAHPLSTNLCLQDIIAFEKANEKDPEVLKKFIQTLFAIRERHANTVPIMAEAVMEVKSNYATKGSWRHFGFLVYLILTCQSASTVEAA
jgi:hypothetical protein